MDCSCLDVNARGVAVRAYVVVLLRFVTFAVKRCALQHGLRSPVLHDTKKRGTSPAFSYT